MWELSHSILFTGYLCHRSGAIDVIDVFIHSTLPVKIDMWQRDTKKYARDSASLETHTGWAPLVQFVIHIMCITARINKKEEASIQ